MREVWEFLKIFEEIYGKAYSKTIDRVISEFCLIDRNFINSYELPFLLFCVHHKLVLVSS